MPFRDIANQRFGRLTAIRPTEKRGWLGGRSAIWLCRCDCGKEKEVSAGNLTSGHTHSCGCMRAVAVQCGLNRKHGLCGTPPYAVWIQMIARCENPNHKNFKDYGGRGITVCDRWRSSVELFVSDMGERKQGMTIERIDNNGNYEPRNCRWATRKEQIQGGWNKMAEQKESAGGVKVWSQNNEQKYILEACQGSERRTLLDIGAFHAETFSNSRALIQAGWSAVLIEPSPGPLRELVKFYAADSQVTVIGGAVAVNPGLLRMEITDDAVSSSEPANVELWRKSGGFLGSMWTPAITLAMLMERFGAFDFVNIDVEGQSVELLHVLLATEMFPRCIAVEHDNRIVEATEAAQARGYRVAYLSRENLVLSL